MIRMTTAASIAALSLAAGAAQAQQPWMNTKLSPDERAALLEKEMTLDERIGLVHGPMSMPIFGIKKPDGAIGSAGYIPGIPRLGVPALEESDASLGVTNTAHQIEVSLWARNLTNDESLISAFPTVAQDGSYSGYPNAPRTYGVTVRKSF